MFERIRRWFRREEQTANWPKGRHRKKRDPHSPLHVSVRKRRERAEQREDDIVQAWLNGRDYDKPSEETDQHE